MADQRSDQPRRTVVCGRDQHEWDAEAGGVGEQENRALDRRIPRGGEGQDAAEDDADAWRPADREDRAEAERRRPAPTGAHDPAAEPLRESRLRITGSCATRSREGHCPGGARDRPCCAGLERPPRPIERRDPEHAGEIQPEHDQEDASQLSQDRQVLEQRAGGIGRRDAEQREHRAEPNDVGERMAHREPARRRATVSTTHDGDRRELPDVGRHEREHARRQEAEQPRPDRDGDGEVVHQLAAVSSMAEGALPKASSSSRRTLPTVTTSSTRWFPSSTTGMRSRYRRCSSGSVSMSRSSTRGTASPRARRSTITASIASRASSHSEHPGRA